MKRAVKQRKSNVTLWVKDTFALPREQARQAVRAYRREYPKAAYGTEIDHWRELPDGRIEVTMRRLPSAD